MKFFITCNLLLITNINLMLNAHQNHEHQIYSWSNSKNKTIKKGKTVNFEKLEDKKNKLKTNH